MGEERIKLRLLQSVQMWHLRLHLMCDFGQSSGDCFVNPMVKILLYVYNDISKLRDSEISCLN